jgi:hypothetical protein
MGMSTHVVGIRPPDEQWEKMRAAWDACEKAGVSPPEVVQDFFEGMKPDPKGVVVEIQGYPCCHEYNDDGRSGFEINLKYLPEDVTVLRFFNSY